MKSFVDCKIRLIGINPSLLLNGMVARVDQQTADTFKLEDDGTSGGFVVTSAMSGTATSISVEKILTWSTASKATTLSGEQGTPDEIDVTLLSATRRSIQFGYSGKQTFKVENLLDPTGAATILIRAASRAKTAKAMRVTFSDLTIMGVNAYWSGGSGFAMSAGDKATDSWNATAVANEVWYSP